MKNGGIVAVGFVSLGIAVAIIVGSRLSSETVAALAGAACGVGLAAPLGIAIGMYVGSSRSRSAATPVPPPQVVVIPPLNPSPSHAPLYPPTLEPLAPRSRPFTIIGEDD